VVEFDSEFNGIVLCASDLNAVNPTSDPQLRSYARTYFESVSESRDTTVLNRVRELIEVLLPTGRCSIDQVARSLNVDRRTVHRRLADSGETFSSLLSATRTQLAEQLVANPHRSLTEISQLLGFSAPSAFSRWFRERFGCSARDWRTQKSNAQHPPQG
jgi:AraC-like DNA-binding protein